MARIKIAYAEAMQIMGAQKDEKGENNDSGRRGYTNQGRAEGVDENRESGCRGYTNQSPAV